MAMPMTNSLNIMKRMGRDGWKGEPRWIKGIRRIKRLKRKFKKQGFKQSI
jgi:hypothetical protein